MEIGLEELLNSGKRLKSYKLERKEMSVDLSVYDVEYSKNLKTEYFLISKEESKLERIHAYINFDILRDEATAYISKNTFPKNLEVFSEGDDSDDFYGSYILNNESNKKKNIFNIINKIFIGIDNKQMEMNSLQLPLNIKMKFKNPFNLSVEREYVLPNSRIDSRGFPTCWHVYPTDSNSIFVVEHPKFIDMYKDIQILTPDNLR